MAETAPDLASVGAVPTTTPEAGSTTRFGPALLALAMGGFAIGTTEFMAMGLLPQIADGVGVSIPTAGHLISAYALGRGRGRPGAGLLRRPAAAARPAGGPDDGVRRCATSLSALSPAPTGCCSSPASCAASRTAPTSGSPRWSRPSLAPRGREGRAVALVMIGLSVANVVGVPAATWLGQHLGWRSAFWVVVGAGAGDRRRWSSRSCPACPGNAEATGRRELGRVPRAAGVAHAAGRCHRLRRHVRALLLHRPGRHRGRRALARARCPSSCWRSVWAWSPAPASRARSPTGRCSARCSARRSAMAVLLLSYAALAPARLVGRHPGLPGGRLVVGARGQPPAPADGRRR